MQLIAEAVRPDPDPLCPWQQLRLRAKILHDDIARARQQLLQAKGDRDRAKIAHLEQAGRAQARAVYALSRVIYPNASFSMKNPL